MITKFKGDYVITIFRCDHVITIFRGDYVIVLFKSNHVIAKFRGDHVIAIDLPGCGMSSWLPKGMMYHDLEILGKLNHSLKGL